MRFATSTWRSWRKPATPKSTTRIAAYEMAYRMQTSGPELIDLSRESAPDPRDVRRRAGQEFLRQQLPAGAAAGGARRAVRAAVPHRLGPPRRSRPTARAGLPRGRPADGSADSGPEVTRPAGEHPGRLGRRVRPHADGRGAGEHEGRPQPPHRRLHHVHGRRRRAAGRNRGRHRRAGLLSDRSASTFTTCRPRCFTCWDWTTRG